LEPFCWNMNDHMMHRKNANGIPWAKGSWDCLLELTVKFEMNFTNYETKVP